MNKIVLLLSIVLLFSCQPNTDYIIQDENEKGLVIKANGNVVVENETIGKISEEGTFTDNEGKVLAKIGKNDILLDSNGNPLVKIYKDGKIDNGSGAFIEWSEGGELLKTGEKTGLKITPVNKKVFRNASIVLYFYLSFDSVIIE